MLASLPPAQRKSPSSMMHARLATGSASDSNTAGEEIVILAKTVSAEYELDFRTAQQNTRPTHRAAGAQPERQASAGRC
jgi:hypothetical protein